MATAIAQRRGTDVKEYTFLWEGIDRNNRNVRGESKAASETVVTSNLRRQGIRITKLRKQTFRGGRRVNEKDITFFTRQLATMLKAGVPNLEMHIYGRGGHGGAISARSGIPFGTWQDRFLEWFRDLGFLEAPGTETKAANEVAAYAKSLGLTIPPPLLARADEAIE